MNDDNDATPYETLEALIRSLTGESDDIERILIPSIPTLVEDGVEYEGVGMIFYRTDGSKTFIGYKEATLYLNDCIQKRRQIPVQIASRPVQ